MSKRVKGHDTIPDLLREQIYLDEVDQRVWQSRNVPRLDSAGQQALEESNRQILAAMPPDDFAARIEEKMQAQADSDEEAPGKARIVKFPAMFTAAATAAACVALAGYVLFGPLGQHTASFSDSDGIRMKGDEHSIQVYRQQDSGESLRVSSGATVSAGAELQLAYQSMSAEYGVLASVDGNGQVTLHYPESLFDEPRLATGSPQLLPYAFRIDNAPSHEEFVFIVSRESFSVQEALQWISMNLSSKNRIQGAAQPAFADGLVRFLINKE